MKHLALTESHRIGGSCSSRSAAWGMRFSTDASTEARCGDAAVAPIFFYNAMLGRVGELVGLTLFEPRYVEMCRRIHRRQCAGVFLFVPNTESYVARAGDEAYVVDVVGLLERPDHTWAVRGRVGTRVVLTCTWVEPETSGLSHARFEEPRVDGAEISVDVVNNMLFRCSNHVTAEESDWLVDSREWGQGMPMLVRFAHSECDPPAHLLISANAARLNRTCRLFLVAASRRELLAMRQSLAQVEAACTDDGEPLDFSQVGELELCTRCAPFEAVALALRELAEDAADAAGWACNLPCDMLEKADLRPASLYGDMLAPLACDVSFSQTPPQEEEEEEPDCDEQLDAGAACSGWARARASFPHHPWHFSTAAPRCELSNGRNVLLSLPAEHLGLERRAALAGLVRLARATAWPKNRLVLLAHKNPDEHAAFANLPLAVLKHILQLAHHTPLTIEHILDACSDVARAKREVQACQDRLATARAAETTE